MSKNIKNRHTQEFRLLPLDEKFFLSLTKLLTDCFKIKNPEQYNLISWKLFPQKSLIAYMALLDNNVVSFYANKEYPIIFEKEHLKSLLCLDMATDKKYRGKGLISKLSKKVYKIVNEKKYDFTIGFSNDEGILVDKNARNYKYVVIGRFVKYHSFTRTYHNLEYSVSELNSIPLNRAVEVSFFQLSNDYKFLDWKYMKRPRNTYKVIQIKNNNKMVALAILLPVTTKRWSIVKIVTYDNFVIWDILLKVILSYLHKNGVKVVAINVLNNSFWKKVFGRSGFFSVPRLSKNYYLTARIHNDSFKYKNEILSAENWILMGGDLL